MNEWSRAERNWHAQLAMGEDVRQQQAGSKQVLSKPVILERHAQEGALLMAPSVPPLPPQPVLLPPPACTGPSKAPHARVHLA